MKSIAKIFESAEFAIAPDTLLTRDGPINDSVMHVINGKISFVGNLDKFCASNPDLVIENIGSKKHLLSYANQIVEIMKNQS